MSELLIIFNKMFNVLDGVAYFLAYYHSGVLRLEGVGMNHGFKDLFPGRSVSQSGGQMTVLVRTSTS